MAWTGYSAEFEDAYERRFASKVQNEKIFNEWVKKYNEWINASRISAHQREIPATKTQIKALAYEAKQEGLTNISTTETIRRKNGKTQEVFRDLITGKFSRNPYTESEQT